MRIPRSRRAVVALSTAGLLLPALLVAAAVQQSRGSSASPGWQPPAVIKVAGIEPETARPRSPASLPRRATTGR